MSVTARGLLLAVGVLGLAVVLAPGGTEAQPEAVTLQPVKYDALKAAVRSHRGKVVVVDVWADFCIPCKEMFPHLLEMQERYAKDGLVCLSVSVDPSSKRDAALAFLREKKATIVNYWIDEKQAFWADKFDTGGPPATFVFDRQGKRAAKFDNNDPDKPRFTPADIEKVVQQLLKEL